LRQYDIGEFREIEQLRIHVEELAQEVLEAVEIDGWLRVEPFEVDVHHVHVLTICEKGAMGEEVERREGAYLVAAGIIVVVLFALLRRIGELFGVSLRLSFRHWVYGICDGYELGG
jgi:hypothetical protein